PTANQPDRCRTGRRDTRPPPESRRDEPTRTPHRVPVGPSTPRPQPHRRRYASVLRLTLPPGLRLLIHRVAVPTKVGESLRVVVSPTPSANSTPATVPEKPFTGVETTSIRQPGCCGTPRRPSSPSMRHRPGPARPHPSSPHRRW